MRRLVVVAGILGWTVACGGGGNDTGDTGAEVEVSLADLRPAVIRDCAGKGKGNVSSYEVELDDGARAGLWIGSLYEGRAGLFGGGGSGHAKVDFELPGKHVLALASKEAMVWTIRVKNTSLTQLERILIASPSTVSVRMDDELVESVPVELVRGTTCGLSYDGPSVVVEDTGAPDADPEGEGDDTGTAEPQPGDECDTEQLIAALEAAAGVTTTRFDGCFKASRFVWEERESEVDTSVPNE